MLERVKCPEPAKILENIYVGYACGSIALRAAKFDKVIVVGEEYEAEPRADLYRRLGMDVTVYPLPSGKAPTLLSLVRLLYETRPCEEEKLLIEGFNSEGVVAAGFLVISGFRASEAAMRLLALGHGLTTPLEARVLKLLELVVRDAPKGFDDVARTVMDGYKRGYLHGDGHASTVAELAIELNLNLSRLGYPSYWNNFQLFKWALEHNEFKATDILGLAAALDSTLVGAVKTIHLGLVKGKLEVHIGCEMLMHEEQCWPEIEASKQHFEHLASKLGASKIEYIMAWPEDVACLNYSEVDKGLCEAEEQL